MFVFFFVFINIPKQPKSNYIFYQEQTNRAISNMKSSVIIAVYVLACMTYSVSAIVADLHACEGFISVTYPISKNSKVRVVHEDGQIETLRWWVPSSERHVLERLHTVHLDMPYKTRSPAAHIKSYPICSDKKAMTCRDAMENGAFSEEVNVNLPIPRDLLQTEFEVRLLDKDQQMIAKFGTKCEKAK